MVTCDKSRRVPHIKSINYPKQGDYENCVRLQTVQLEMSQDEEVGLEEVCHGYLPTALLAAAKLIQSA